MPSLPAFVFCSGSFRASARFDVKSTLSLRSFRSLIQSKVCTEIYTHLKKKTWNCVFHWEWIWSTLNLVTYRIRPDSFALCILATPWLGETVVVAGERGTTAAYLQEINICAYIDKLAFSNLFATEAFPVPFCLQALLYLLPLLNRDLSLSFFALVCCFLIFRQFPLPQNFVT